jgi:polysaccharide deacetylase family protein (PEP-CTERM system associated)
MTSNCLTIDVEEYFEQAPAEVASVCESRLELEVGKTLDLLAGTGDHATFFFLARLASKFPALVRRVADAGHRIGCHGLEHVFLDRLPLTEAERMVRQSIGMVREAAGLPVESFRAPFFSINACNRELLAVLADEGVRFDSSIFPGRHPDYGWPGAPVKPFTIELPGGAKLHEVPVTTASFAGIRTGIAGGGWLRMLPWPLTRLALKRISASGAPLVLYLHPWELDPDQPRLKLDMRFPLRHYLFLGRTEGRVREILNSYRFGPLEDADLSGAPMIALSDIGNPQARR